VESDVGKRADPLLLGIDGGASKTTGAIIDETGRLLAHAKSGGSAVVGKPNPQSLAVLSELAQSLCERAEISRDAIAHCVIGLNGVDFEDEHPVQHRDVSTAIDLLPVRVSLVNDAIVALWGATGAPAATMVQHGSGFTAAYRGRYGGETLFDHLDVGAVFDMRRGLIAAVARMINGQIEPTPLKAAVLDCFGIQDESEYGEAIFRQRVPRRLRARTPPLIYRAWLDGDPVAASLVHRACEDYVLAARAMVAKTGSPSPDVAFGGGVIDVAPDEFWDLLAKHLRESHPDLTPARPILAPELGGAVMAGHCVGLSPQELFPAVQGEVEAAQ
jgi:N-acetylglucosamine kinase-like BadF-type ATPase